MVKHKRSEPMPHLKPSLIRLTFSLFGWGLFLNLSLLTVNGFAEPNHLSESDRVAAAQEAMSKGLEFIKSKRYAEAAESLDLSYRTHPSNEVLHLLARLYDKLPKECIRSMAAWKMLIDRCDKSCELHQDALAKLKASEISCQGELRIKTEPSAADLYINNERVSKTPFSLSTLARLHHIVLLKEGYEPSESKVVLERGWSSDELFVKLVPNKKNRGKESSIDRATSIATSPHPSSSSSLRLVEEPQAKVKESPSPAWHVDFSAEEDPFTRLKPLEPIQTGKIAISGERSIISKINCEYRSRFQRYLPISDCDGARVAPFDRFFISLIPQQDSYLYLVMSNDKGQWQLIFPQEGEDHLFKANQISSIPQKEWILFDKVRDTIDVISLIASPRPIPELEAERSRSDSKGLPPEVMQYFVPMAQTYEESAPKSSRILKAQTQYVINHPQVLHTSFEVYR